MLHHSLSRSMEPDEGLDTNDTNTNVFFTLYINNTKKMFSNAPKNVYHCI